MSTPSHTPPFIVTEAATFIGIDYHKKYSVYHAVNELTSQPMALAVPTHFEK